MADEIQPITPKETPMGHVWLIVFLSMSITLAASWIWHLKGMNTERRYQDIENEPIIKNIEQIAKYRDILKEKGKDAAVASLTASQ